MKQSTINKQEHFISYTAELLHEVTMIFYSSKSEYPIDRALLDANAFYSAILFDVASNRLPTRAEAERYHPPGKKDVDLTWQNMIDLYESWKSGGAATSRYCAAMQRLLERKQWIKTKNSYILAPNLESRSLEIENNLKAILANKNISSLI